MPNLFDGKKNAAYGIVADTMGYDAFWTPSTDTVQQKARVLFNDPTVTYKVLKIEYDPVLWSMEYLGTKFFTNLFTNVRQNLTEIVTIEGIDYYVKAVRQRHDGDTHLAILELKT